MLNIIGLGLRGVKSLTLEEFDVLKNSDIIYFETYTSVSPENTLNYLNIITGKKVIGADRNFMENTNGIIENSSKKNVSLIVTGDALSATTHNEIREEALKNSIDVKIYENASIITAFVSKTGLFNYKFGQIVSIPYIHENFFPLSVYDKIYNNYENKMHTLLLLDLKDNKTMDPYYGIQILSYMENKKNKNLINDNTKIIIGTKIASTDEQIIYTDVGTAIKNKISGSPASIILPSELNDKEKEFINLFCKIML